MFPPSALDRYFRDDRGRRWEVFISERTHQRIVDQCFFTVPTPSAIGSRDDLERVAELFLSLISDRAKVVNVLWVIVQPQAESRGISRAEFDAGLDESYCLGEQKLFEAFAEFNRGNELEQLIMPIYKRTLLAHLERGLSNER